MKSELNTRQWALYNYLKDQGDAWTMQYKVAAELSEYYGDIVLQDFHDSAARLLMTNDIRKINNSGIIQKIIISGRNGVKLANSQEFDRYIGKEINAAVRRLMRAKHKAEKASKDGMLRLTFGGEREVIQAFIDSNSIGAEWRQARQAKGLTQKQAAEGLNKFTKMDAPTLSKIENGVCLPNGEQNEAFVRFYLKSDNSQH